MRFCAQLLRTICRVHGSATGRGCLWMPSLKNQVLLLPLVSSKNCHEFRASSRDVKFAQVGAWELFLSMIFRAYQRTLGSGI